MSELLKFKAGRVEYNEESGEATPIRGQGNVVLKRSSEDESLLAIQWQPRAAYGQSLVPTEELMVLPGDVTFEHIEECETGRVISLKFESSGRREMYWLQDPVAGDLNQLSSADRHILERLNELANQDLDEEEEEEEEEAASEPVAVAPPSAAAPLRGPLALAGALNSAALASHISSTSQGDIDELLATVSPHAATRDDLDAWVRSPHFQAALSQLDAVLQGGGTRALCAEAGVEYEGEGVEAFLNALRKRYKK